MNKKVLNFTENFLLSLAEFSEILTQPVIINKAYWAAVQREKEKMEKIRKERHKYYATIYRLEKYGYLKKEMRNKQIQIKLTNKGLIKLQRIKWKKMKESEKNKNQKLCVVVFDIPEDKRRMRNLFRQCLYEMGFSRLQKSVFASHYNLGQEIELLVKNCELEKYVRIFEGKEIKL